MVEEAVRHGLVAHHVEERLRAAGSVLLVGSYVTGLMVMVWRDLDVCVDISGPRTDGGVGARAPVRPRSGASALRGH